MRTQPPDLEVMCWRCKALPGSYCTSLSGRRKYQCHAVRRRLSAAYRLEHLKPRRRKHGDALPLFP
jgi:hypothetical protein